MDTGYSRYTCVIGSDHTVGCWGDNSDGQLGDGTTTSRVVPTPVDVAVATSDLGIQTRAARRADFVLSF